MRLNLTIGSALLGLLVGMVAWALHPSYKAFSWVETVELDYFAGFLPDRTAFGPGDLPPLSIADYEAALSSLTATVQGDYDASVGIGGMGRRLVLEGGESHPVFFEQYVTPGYFAGRNVGAALGRLPEPGELGVVVIGHAFAERVFADPRSAVVV